MGRRYFYAIVDETYRQIERQNADRPGEYTPAHNQWVQRAKAKALNGDV